MISPADNSTTSWFEGAICTIGWIALILALAEFGTIVWMTIRCLTM